MSNNYTGERYTVELVMCEVCGDDIASCRQARIVDKARRDWLEEYPD